MHPMSAENKKRVLIYKRADFITNESRTLQAILETALKACPKTGQRVQAVTSEGEEANRMLLSLA